MGVEREGERERDREGSVHWEKTTKRAKKKLNELE